MMSQLGREESLLMTYGAALEQIHTMLEPLERERIPIEEALGRFSARDLIAPFQIPTCPLSLRDGFALRAADTQGAGLDHLRQFQVLGQSFPDTPAHDVPTIGSGEAVTVATGAPIPNGADAVLPAEIANQRGDLIFVSLPVRTGSGVLLPGDDVRDGAPIVTEGRALTPSQMGLLAATGLSHIEVYRRPQVAVIATGDEIIAGSESLARGRTSSGVVPTGNGHTNKPPSNAVALTAWCQRFGLTCKTWVAGDNHKALGYTLSQAMAECDAVITIGGTGPGVRDLVLQTLEDQGWEAIVQGVRLRPGRRSCFGLLADRPVFLLPGTPTAAEAAFLLVALPGLMRLAGSADPPFIVVPARLTRDLKRTKEARQWAQAVRVRLSPGTFFLQATPLVGRSIQEKRGRLGAAAISHGLVLLGEGEESARVGDVVGVLVLESGWS